MLSGPDDEHVLQIDIEKLKDRFETVDLGGVKFLLGMYANAQKRARRNHCSIYSRKHTRERFRKRFGMADTTLGKNRLLTRGPCRLERKKVSSTGDTTLFRHAATFSSFSQQFCPRPDVAHAVIGAYAKYVENLFESGGQNEKGFEVPKRHDFDRIK